MARYYSSIEIFDKRMISLWRGDESISGIFIEDSSQNNTNTGSWIGGNDGTISGATFTDGKIGSCLSFDGVDDFIESSHNSTIDFDRTDPFSFVFWIKNSQNTDVFIFNKNLSSNPKTGYTFQFDANGKLTFVLQNDNVAGNRFRVDSTNNTLISSGSWTHFAITYNGNSSGAGIKIYQNGSSIPTTVVTESLTGSTTNTANFYLGALNGTSFFVSGAIDEFSIWSKELTSGYISSLYSKGIGSKANEVSFADNDLVAYYPMYSGTKAWDESKHVPGRFSK